MQSIKFTMQNARSTFQFKRFFCDNQQILLSKSSEETFETYTRISKSYEKMANLVTLWFHKKWRKVFVSKLKVSENMKIIDAAGGQGHTTVELLKMAQSLNMKPSFHITICDFCPAMMQIGKATFGKLSEVEGTKDVDWVLGNIHNLPFANNYFDRYVSSFGIRGLDLDKVLQEAHRVMKPGGQLLLMDISNSKNPIVRSIFYRYLRYVVPTISKLLYNESEAMVYLANSLKNMPDNEEMVKTLQDAGFNDVSCTTMALGMVSYFEGSKSA